MIWRFTIRNIYIVVFEVLDVVLVVYYAQHTFKHNVVLEVKHVVLEVYHTQRTFNICFV